MLCSAFNVFENLYCQPDIFGALGQAAQSEYHGIDALTDTTEARRGIRHGMLKGMLAGACVAHAIALPADCLWGTGALLSAATWAHHRAVLRAQQPISGDPSSVYGAPRGLVGPPIAALVGATAGIVGATGGLVGGVAGLLTSPTVLFKEHRRQRFSEHIRGCKTFASSFAFDAAGAIAAIIAAFIGDIARLPGVCIKALLPLLGLMVGACVGSLGGLRDVWPHGLSACSLASGQRAALLTREHSLHFLTAGLGLWAIRVDTGA